MRTLEFGVEERKRVGQLFARYGFKAGYTSNPTTHIVFTIRSGYFHQAEILVFDDRDKDGVATTRAELEKSGFACSTREFAGHENLEDRLFEGFFGVEASQVRHRHHYKSFITRIERTIRGKYAYINSSYSKDGVLIEQKSIVDEILNALSCPEPTLVLLEAAAGFGKTCTAYEVLARVVEAAPNRPPLFIELARNRQATLFRYVLLDEIDRNYPSLRSELVTSEITSGKVLLIIDGFDELLRRSLDERPADENESAKLESMLDTIAALLTGNAKVVLTTRKTAMFSASTFDAWTSDRRALFRPVRLVLREPSLRDWLGSERANRIEELGALGQALANPVLLSFLRNSNDVDFTQYLESTDLLVDRYFQTLLERELERQDINIDYPNQLSIYRRLADYMIVNDIFAGSRIEIAEVIRDTNREILDESIRRYPPATRPTVEQLSERLAGHALLDRFGSTEDQVGFVNEFVAGTLFGDALVSNQHLICSEKVLDLATWAFQVRGQQARTQLYQSTDLLRGALLPLERLSVALRLLGHVSEPLLDCLLESLEFKNLQLGYPHGIANCVFVDCTFRQVCFTGCNIKNCGFVNCRFYECSLQSACEDSWCTGGISFPDSEFSEQLTSPPVEVPEKEIALDVEVLRQFWPKGKAYASTRLRVRTIYRGFSMEKKAGVADALEALRRAGLITYQADFVELAMERIGEIRERLGR